MQANPSGDSEHAAGAGISEAHASAFEQYVQSRAPGLKQFGYDLFREPPSTFAPVDNIPVGPDYILGPGDELRVSIWGKMNAEFTALVDREGNLSFPQLGVIHLSGLTFAEAREFLEKEFSRLYLASEVKMNVSMGSLRSIRVFVVGKAFRPGSYTVSSLSTLVNMLFLAGGPSKVGTMRGIQVKRNGKVVTHFDFYDLLLHGDKTKDVRLMPEDVIFIPPSGPLAAIYGDVLVPAIYELKGEAQASDLIGMAGGLNDIAFKGRVQIERIVENSRTAVFESDLEGLKAGVSVSPGDIVRIFPVVQDKKVVRLSGAVKREGEYGVGDGLRVKDLLEMAGGVRYFAFLDDAELTRVTATQEGPSTVKLHVNLGRALTGDPEHNIELKQDDYLFIRAVPEWELYKTVSVSGEVRFPGTYTITKGETVSSLIGRAGGFTDKAYLRGAAFTRESVKELQQKRLDEAIDRLEHQVLAASAETIGAALTPEAAMQQEAAARQRRALVGKMRAARAMGRISVRITDIEKFKGSPSDLALEEGDHLFIPERPSQVQVMGSVYNPSAFVYTPKGTVSSYLKKAGGLTGEADDDEMYVLKMDGTAMSKRQGGLTGVRWDSEENEWRGGSFKSARLEPGDTVVVPEKIERVHWMREVKDITQILYQIAVTAGVLIVAF
ncbi:MAG: SLBB domain-containing protein [Deltaproteobacteria bacterium]|nr:SLBB domain-containing protein [Deltaproteobacteria bacterium]